MVGERLTSLAKSLMLTRRATGAEPLPVDSLFLCAKGGVSHDSLALRKAEAEQKKS